MIGEHTETCPDGPPLVSLLNLVRIDMNQVRRFAWEIRDHSQARRRKETPFITGFLTGKCLMETGRCGVLYGHRQWNYSHAGCLGHQGPKELSQIRLANVQSWNQACKHAG